MNTRFLLLLILAAFTACKDQQTKVAGFATGMQAAVYYNGDILTMEGDTPQYAEAIAIQDGRILYVGPKAEAIRLAGANHQLVDLEGQTLLPGFVDGHSHITNYADALLQADLNPPPTGPVTNIAGIIKALQELKVRLHAKEGDLLVGYGYDADQLKEKRHPNAADLDAAFPDNPVILKHTSGHMLVANSAAFRLANISAATKDPEGGTFIRKKGSQEPEGLVQEMAMAPFVAIMAKPMPLDIEMKKLKDAQAYYAANGVTTADEHLAVREKMALLDTAAARGDLFLDIVALPAFIYAKELVGGNKVQWRQYNNRLKYQGIKMATDGSPQGKTAYLSKPYLTPVPGCQHNCVGFPNMTQEQISQLMLLCYKNGVQLFAHCNGDASIDMMIKGHQYAVRQIGDSTTDRRTVIIHSQIMRPDQLLLYKQYNLFPSFFTNHTYYWGDAHLANLGKERADYLSPIKSAMELGIRCSNHTDNIVTPMDQMFLLWTSVNRVSRSGVVVGPQQRITPYQGLQTLTINGAYEFFEEKEKGTLTAGKLADIVILNKNPLKVAPEQIKNIQVITTLKEGKIVYQRGKQA